MTGELPRWVVLKEMIPGPGKPDPEGSISVKHYLDGDVTMTYTDYYGDRLEVNPEWDQLIETTITKWLILKT